MRLVVVAVGRIKERGLRELLDDYAKRIARYARFEEVEVKDGDHADLLNRVERAGGPNALVVALEVDGEALSSDGLAKWMARRLAQGSQPVVFVVGGSYGLGPEVRARANVCLSLSAMTLPHRLARLVLFEQIYRAFTIVRGEPYSH